MFVSRSMIAGAAGLWLAHAALAADQPMSTSVTPDGTVSGTVTVPLSQFLSAESKAALAKRMNEPSMLDAGGDIAKIRATSAKVSQERFEKWNAKHPVTVESQVIDGVRVDIVTPKDGVAPENADRVLINAHGGGFFTGGENGGKLEAAPLAAIGRIKVIAVDYRMAPEHLFPAASEDMETIYRHVLKSVPAENVGVYGCSAGGTLTAQSVAWFRSKGLPRPGAAGVFCAGVLETFWYGGDIGSLARLLNALPTPPADGAARPTRRDHFEGIDIHSPLITPADFPEELAAFPPTLVVSGTRDIAMSNAVMTHTRLLQAGARAELFIQEGLGHGDFAYMPATPEAELAHKVIWDFFDRHLGR